MKESTVKRAAELAFELSKVLREDDTASAVEVERISEIERCLRRAIRMQVASDRWLGRTVIHNGVEGTVRAIDYFTTGGAVAVLRVRRKTGEHTMEFHDEYVDVSVLDKKYGVIDTTTEKYGILI